jgi:E3 ubiquitin-protein ligase HECTD2
MLRPEEVELLVCGNPSLDMRELQRVTVYDGYTAESETVRYDFLKIDLRLVYLL